MSDKPYRLSSMGDEVARYSTFEAAVAAVPEVRETYGVYARALVLTNEDQTDLGFDGLTEEERERWQEVA